MTSWGHGVTAAAGTDEALHAMRTGRFDFLLTDFRLEAGTGLDLLKACGQKPDAPITAVMTAFASFENAVTAIKEGAFDYLPKPFSNAQLEALLKRVQMIVDLRRENERLRSGLYREDFFAGQSSPGMARLEEFVAKVAPSDASVLLIGESGTGKTELARLIHARSSRANKPFVVIDCATLAETLLESELFGHVRGAFTGASQEHVGKLEHANHGTLLIDEIGDLSLNGQARLLRFLQERIIERVGGNQAITLDVRVIAATNRDLEEAVKGGRFREDLYYRLNTFECSLVPLRFRREDLPVLIHRFLLDSLGAAREPDSKRVPGPVLDLMNSYSWPGNIRELRNSMERLVLLSKGREMETSDLPKAIIEGLRKAEPESSTALRSLEEVERRHIERVLSSEKNLERAAEILGITSVTLWRKRKQYGLQ